MSNRVVRHDEPHTGRRPTIVRGVLRQRGGLWLGWSGNIAHAPALTAVRDRRDGFDSAAFDLDVATRAAMYDGFPAHVLHPLLQSRLNDMAFDRSELDAWLRANRLLAGVLRPQLHEGDRIWINDLHLLPLARALRALGVGNRIGLFLHDGLPAASVLASMPYHDRVFGALGACDVVGVQTPADRRALCDYLASEHAATGDGGDCVRLGSRRVRVSAFPVGIDVDYTAGLARQALERPSLRKFRRSLGAQKLLVGVDRPDPGNGLCQRLQGIDQLLRQWPQLAGTFLMLQIAPPVRYDMPRSRELDREISRLVSDLNGHHAGPDWSPVRYVKKEFHARLLAGYLRIADIGLMTPLHDGMALAAKEYVACQDPADPGVLVLSRFAGAACELTDAVQVNPRDAADVAAGIRTAMRMSRKERQARWEALMGTLRRHDLRRWSDDFLGALDGPRVIRAHQALAIGELS